MQREATFCATYTHRASPYVGVFRTFRAQVILTSVHINIGICIAFGVLRAFMISDLALKGRYN